MGWGGEAFCLKFGKMPRILVCRRVSIDYFNITQGGSSQFITLLHGVEGSTRTRNLYNVINERLLVKAIGGGGGGEQELEGGVHLLEVDFNDFTS